MDELLNPFRPGAGTPPPELVGRDGLIDTFGVTLRRAMAGRPGKSLLLVGLRGVGKTVLLNRFAEIAELEGAAVGYLEATDDGDFQSQLAQRLRRILLRFDRHKPSAAVLRALRALKGFSIHLPDGSSVSLDVDALRGVADSGVLVDDLVDLLEAVGEAAREVDLCVLLVIDEMQVLGEEQVAALVTAIHRTVQRSLPVVLVGGGLPQLPGPPREHSVLRGAALRDRRDRPPQRRGRGRPRLPCRQHARASSSTTTPSLSSCDAPWAIPTSCRSGAITCGTPHVGPP